MGWQDEVTTAIEDVGPLQIEIEIEGDTPASEVSAELEAIAESTSSESTILIGARTLTVDSETYEPVGIEAWRMLAIRGPAKAILGIAADKLSDWADAALRRSRVTLVCLALTIRVYP